VGCVNVLDSEEIMCITSQGKSIKLKVKGIRVMGRSAQGVRILSIEKPDFVIGVDRIVQEDDYGKKDAAKNPADTGPDAKADPNADAELDFNDDTDAGIDDNSDPDESGDEL
jgi:DNA gyrase subunit A